MPESIKNFEPPESGDAPQEVKDILRKVYSNCRQSWVEKHPQDKENQANKQSCARISWDAVKDAGYEKNKEGKWVRVRDFTNPRDNDFIPQ